MQWQYGIIARSTVVDRHVDHEKKTSIRCRRSEETLENRRKTSHRNNRKANIQRNITNITNSTNSTN